MDPWNPERVVIFHAAVGEKNVGASILAVTGVDALVFAVMDPEPIEERRHPRIFCQKRSVLQFTSTRVIVIF